MNKVLQNKLNSFLNELDLEKLLEGLNHADRSNSLNLLDTFKNEAVVALSMIDGSIKPGIRILEVGSGLCLLSLFLKQQGYNIVALEPLAGGFGFFEKLKNKILIRYSKFNLPILDKSAEQLSEVEDGCFDLIFSNNVVEHIDALDEAFIAMRSVLTETGCMVHGCPNYVVPYEPHLGLPVLSFAPKLTRAIWKNRVDMHREMWNSLNFVTYFKMRTLARDINCGIQFKNDMTYNAFERLGEDQQFQQRHNKTLVGKVYRVLKITRLLHLTKLLPPWLATPMVFSLTPINIEK